jgi:hypothetical protein
MTRRSLAHLRAVTIIAALAVMAWLAGCHPAQKPVVDPTPRITAPLNVLRSEITAESTEHAATLNDLKTADKLTVSIPPANVAVKSAAQHTVAAQVHNRIAATQAVVVNDAAVAVGKESVADQTETNAWKAKYDAVENSLPMKLWHCGEALLVAYFALRILAGVLVLPAQSSPVVKGVLAGIRFILSFGGSAVESATSTAHAAFDEWHATPGTPAPAGK